VIDTVAVAPSWRVPVDAFFASEHGKTLLAFLAQREAAGARIYPPEPLRALALTPLSETRVVILGQDPYHGPGQAHGLAFSVPDGVRPPPSLRNVFLELRTDLGCQTPGSGNLEIWARQGVLLLNTVLTVEEGLPGRHAARGWEQLTDALIAALAHDTAPKAFLLWGAQAQAKDRLIDATGRGHHLILAANHPSPLSARRPPVPFLGSRHFSRANAFLGEHGRGAVDWSRA
jgi:uracil-DNA glycosylase